METATWAPTEGIGGKVNFKFKNTLILIISYPPRKLRKLKKLPNTMNSKQRLGV